MIKEVDTIPVTPKTDKITRRGTLIKDIRTALYNHIPRFEFVGDIYTTCNGRYKANLSRALVVEEGPSEIRRYINAKVRAAGIDTTQWGYWPVGFRDTCAVHSCFGENGERVFMEIDFDEINLCIDRTIKQYSKEV